MKYILPIFLLSISIASVAHAEINRTLKLGDRGEDVKELQIILNRDPATRIATQGIGAPGNESTYFGARTLAAVRAFQTKYAFEVLSPAGLSVPTGTVGLYTRVKLYKLSLAQQSTSTTSVSSATSNTLSITSITPTVVTRSPQQLTITGTGFTPDTKVMFSSETGTGSVPTVTSPTSLSVVLPYTIVQKLRAQLAPYRSLPTYSAIKAAFVRSISEASGTVQVQVILKNSTSQSSPVKLTVDIASML